MTRRSRRHKRLDEIMLGLADTYERAFDSALRGRRHPAMAAIRNIRDAIRMDTQDLDDSDATRWWWTNHAIQDLIREQGYQDGHAERLRLAQELFAQDATPLPADPDDTPPTTDTGDYERRD